jgi:Lar family restriction alleviation protein
MNTRKLKPCPFCGCNDLLLYTIVGYSVFCRQCGVETRIQETRRMAVDAWNRRAETAKRRQKRKAVKP